MLQYNKNTKEKDDGNMETLLKKFKTQLQQNFTSGTIRVSDNQIRIGSEEDDISFYITFQLTNSLSHIEIDPLPMHFEFGNSFIEREIQFISEMLREQIRHFLFRNRISTFAEITYRDYKEPDIISTHNGTTIENLYRYIESVTGSRKWLNYTHPLFDGTFVLKPNVKRSCIEVYVEDSKEDTIKTMHYIHDFTDFQTEIENAWSDYHSFIENEVFENLLQKYPQAFQERLGKLYGCFKEITMEFDLIWQNNQYCCRLKHFPDFIFENQSESEKKRFFAFLQTDILFANLQQDVYDLFYKHDPYAYISYRKRNNEIRVFFKGQNYRITWSGKELFSISYELIPEHKKTHLANISVTESIQNLLAAVEKDIKALSMKELFETRKKGTHIEKLCMEFESFGHHPIALRNRENDKNLQTDTISYFQKHYTGCPVLFEGSRSEIILENFIIRPLQYGGVDIIEKEKISK